MEGETSWLSHSPNDKMEFDSFVELNDNESEKEASTISLDLILPDDILEYILTYLPIASIFRAGSVCKRWLGIVTSKRFVRNASHVLSQKPWYFMFTNSDEPAGCCYDPVLRKWYNIDLPCIETSNFFIASSCGLVCFMGKDSSIDYLYICNPITKSYKWLDGPPIPKYPDYSALAVLVDRVSHNYGISVVTCKEIPGDFFRWDLSIHVYNSEAMTWKTALREVLVGWRAGEESVICDGVLYILVYSLGGWRENRHGLLTYDLKARPPRGLLMRSFVPGPGSLTCGRLMNIKEKLVMVGGIGRHDRAGVIKGIGIWGLKGEEWEEIARIPPKHFQGFGEIDDVFASSGTEGLIYIHSYGSPALLVFDVSVKQWKWGQKCPVTKKFSLQLFTGFCFEPTLEIAP
ncbi:hypothetical protein OROMI_017504 [Orobanche minor]